MSLSQKKRNLDICFANVCLFISTSAIECRIKWSQSIKNVFERNKNCTYIQRDRRLVFTPFTRWTESVQPLNCSIHIISDFLPVGHIDKVTRPIISSVCFPINIILEKNKQFNYKSKKNYRLNFVTNCDSQYIKQIRNAQLSPIKNITILQDQIPSTKKHTERIEWIILDWKNCYHLHRTQMLNYYITRVDKLDAPKLQKSHPNPGTNQ